MLIGTKNNVNDKLLGEISKIFSTEFVNYTKIQETSAIFDLVEPRIILVNLMDVGGSDTQLLSILRNRFPNLKIMGLHCFNTEQMISSTLAKGFDGYLSVFDFSNDFHNLLDATGINPSDYILVK